MIAGIGVDIVDIHRIRRAAAKSGGRFLDRIFTPGEREYCLARPDPYPSLAGRFAAKEAVLKALGAGLAGCGWQDVEVLPGPGGTPLVHLHGGAAALARARGVTEVVVSVAHEKEYAVAFAVALGRKE
ncbi:MAG: holo-ACP synthase [Bacillota bacterium]